MPESAPVGLAKRAKQKSGFARPAPLVDLPALLRRLADAEAAQIRDAEALPPAAAEFLQRSLAKCLGRREEEIVRAQVAEMMRDAQVAGKQIDWAKATPPVLPREKQASLSLILGQGAAGKGVLRLQNKALSLLEPSPIIPSAPKPPSVPSKTAAPSKTPVPTFVPSLVPSYPPAVPSSAPSYTLSSATSPVPTPKIVGRSTALEKSYLRAGEPRAEDIRPERILRTALRVVVAKYEKGLADHIYLLDQLRAIRQDLLVQSIQNEFAAEVYETNALFAIQHADQLQTDECLSQLMDLYRCGIRGRRVQFSAYRLALMALSASPHEVQRFLRSLPAPLKCGPDFLAALRVVESLNSADFAWIFDYLRTGEDQPLRGLFRLFLERLRVWRLRALAFSSRPLPCKEVAELLLFESRAEFLGFLKEAGLPTPLDGLLPLPELRTALEKHRFADKLIY